jgi:hypothetical protein
MANGYIVGSVLDQGGALNPAYPSTTAKVEVRLKSTGALKRTLYLTKAVGDSLWHYSTSITPALYRVYASDTTKDHLYTYQDQFDANVTSGGVVGPLDFQRLGPIDAREATDKDVLGDVEVERDRIEKKHSSKVRRLGLPCIEIDPK